MKVIESSINKAPLAKVGMEFGVVLALSKSTAVGPVPVLKSPMG